MKYSRLGLTWSKQFITPLTIHVQLRNNGVL
jgi:hypothetical protein